MFRLAFTLASLALFGVADAQNRCASGECYVSPANATDSGCDVWDGGVDAWATCGFEGAVRRRIFVGVLLNSTQHR